MLLDDGSRRALCAVDDDAVRVTWSDDFESTFHFVWLKDACQSNNARHPSGQKITSLADIPFDIKPLSVSIDAVKASDAGNATVCWAPPAGL